MIEARILKDRQVELSVGEIIEMSPKGMPHYTLGEDGKNYLRQLLANRAYVQFDGLINLKKLPLNPILLEFVYSEKGIIKDILIPKISYSVLRFLIQL